MRKSWSVIGLSCVLACGGSALQNAPRPNPSAVAGVAAAIAGAATLAAPDAAGRRADANKPTSEPRPIPAGPNVPTDVLDRLDESQARGRRAANHE